MELITSVNNQRVKDIADLKQKKYRMESGLFFAEGHPLRVKRLGERFAAVPYVCFWTCMEPEPPLA